MLDDKTSGASVTEPVSATPPELVAPRAEAVCKLPKQVR